MEAIKAKPANVSVDRNGAGGGEVLFQLALEAEIVVIGGVGNVAT